MPEQIPFGTNDFAENPEPRVPCVLLLDTSGSMAGAKIQELNEALVAFKGFLVADSLAAKRVELAIVTFGPVRTLVEFTTASQFQPPLLVPSGDTPLGAAAHHAIDMVTARKQVYKDNGIAYYRPWIFLITDGAPNPGDPWQAAATAIKNGEQARAFYVFGVGVDGADFEMLRHLCVREPLKLEGLEFGKMFLWLSSSLSSVSKSAMGDAVPLQNPTGPDGWATVG